MAADPDRVSLLPITLALVVAIATRIVSLGLFVGLFCGVLMLHGMDPLVASGALVRDHLVAELTDPYNAGVLAPLGFPLGRVSGAGFRAALATAKLAAGCISFATGSSWGTFAIMMPLALPAAVAVDAPLYVCIGAVLSGGLFGDHSSPISETTILSATGAGCDPFQHFHTQFPYALGNGALCVAGYLAAGVASTPWLLGALLASQIALICFAVPKRR